MNPRNLAPTRTQLPFLSAIFDAVRITRRYAACTAPHWARFIAPFQPAETLTEYGRLSAGSGDHSAAQGGTLMRPRKVARFRSQQTPSDHTPYTVYRVASGTQKGNNNNNSGSSSNSSNNNSVSSTHTSGVSTSTHDENESAQHAAAHRHGEARYHTAHDETAGEETWESYDAHSNLVASTAAYMRSTATLFHPGRKSDQGTPQLHTHVYHHHDGHAPHKQCAQSCAAPRTRHTRNNDDSRIKRKIREREHGTQPCHNSPCLSQKKKSNWTASAPPESADTDLGELVLSESAGELTRLTGKPPHPLATRAHAQLMRQYSKEATSAARHVPRRSSSKRGSKRQKCHATSAHRDICMDLLEKDYMDSCAESELHALNRLNNAIPHARAAMKTVRTRPGLCLATLTLHPTHGITAVGQGRSAKVARRRCALHALRIAQLMREGELLICTQADHTRGSGMDGDDALDSALTPTTPTRAGTSAHDEATRAEDGAAGESSAASSVANVLWPGQRAADLAASDAATWENVIQSLDTRLARLYRVFRTLCDTAAPKMHFRTRGAGAGTLAAPSSVAVSGSRDTERVEYVCQLHLHGVTCEGCGVNRFEAQRAAMISALTELEMHDADMQHVSVFLKQHPRVHVEAMPVARLPADLHQRIRECVHEMQGHLRESAEQLPASTTIAKGAPGDGAPCSSTATTVSSVTASIDATTHATPAPPVAAAAAAAEAESITTFNTSDPSMGTRVLSAVREDAPLRNALSSDSGATSPSPHDIASPSPTLSARSARMRAALCALRVHPHYLTHYHTRRVTLPMASYTDTILSSVAQNRVTIICGTTGCGKTTQVPQYILDHEIMCGRGDRCQILVTQPRRLSTFGVAERVAHERMSLVGDEVGYAVRLDAKPGRSLTLCTSGVLLQMLSTDPHLTRVSHLIIDEVHERDVNCDIVLALTKQLLQHNHAIRVILMSATIQADLFADYFDHAPMIHVEGSTYPVKEYFLEDISLLASGRSGPSGAANDAKCATDDNSNANDGSLAGNASDSSAFAVSEASEKTRSLSFLMPRPFRSVMFDQVGVRTEQNDVPNSPRQQQQSHSHSQSTHRHRGCSATQSLAALRIDYNLIAYLVHRSVISEPCGGEEGWQKGKSILVFLPGWREMCAAREAIMQFQVSSFFPHHELRFHFIMLHSSVGSKEQRECFVPAPEGMVKVILATNIAESGVTIDDAAVVIDSGLVKQTTWRITSPRGTASQSKQYAASSGHTSTLTRDSTTNKNNNNNDATSLAYSTQLSVQRASRANCTQRKGRAGRTRGGVCYRLFSRATWQSLPDYPRAEIHRVPLTQVILKLLFRNNVDVRTVLQSFLEPPSSQHVTASLCQLQDLGALDAEERLTALGRYLSQLPCEPRIGKMIMLGAVLGCLDSVLVLAATADANPFVTTRESAAWVRARRYLFARHSESDHVSALNAYNAYCANANVLASSASALSVTRFGRDSREGAGLRQGSGARVDDFIAHNHLHRGRLHMIARYKAQYREILRGAGFACAPASLPSHTLHPIQHTSQPTTCTAMRTSLIDMSRADRVWRTNNYRNNPNDDSDGGDWGATKGRSEEEEDEVDDVVLVKACVCGSLFPNIAMLDVGAASSVIEKNRHKARMRTLLPLTQSSKVSAAPADAHAMHRCKLTLRTKTYARIMPSNDSACRRIGGPVSSQQDKSSKLAQLQPAATRTGQIGGNKETIDFTLQDNNHNNNASASHSSHRSNDSNVVERDVGNGESSNTMASKSPALFYVYEDIFTVREARQQFLRSVSAVSLWALLLFGASEAKMSYHAHLRVCVIDGWIVIAMDPDTYDVIRGLRELLGCCIWRKYTHPHDPVNHTVMRRLRVLSRAVLRAKLSYTHQGVSFRVDDADEATAGVIISPLSLHRSVSRSNSLATRELFGSDSERDSLACDCVNEDWQEPAEECDDEVAVGLASLEKDASQKMRVHVCESEPDCNNEASNEDKDEQT